MCLNSLWLACANYFLWLAISNAFLIHKPWCHIDSSQEQDGIINGIRSRHTFLVIFSSIHGWILVTHSLCLMKISKRGCINALQASDNQTQAPRVNIEAKEREREKSHGCSKPIIFSNAVSWRTSQKCLYKLKVQFVWLLKCNLSTASSEIYIVSKHSE